MKKIKLKLTELTNLFMLEMFAQGIETLEELFENITDEERTALVNAICSSEFIKLYETVEIDKGDD